MWTYCNLLPFQTPPVQTFLQTVTTHGTNGSLSVVKSIPCGAGSSIDICIVEVSVACTAIVVNRLDPMKYHAGYGSSKDKRFMESSYNHLLFLNEYNFLSLRLPPTSRYRDFYTSSVADNPILRHDTLYIILKKTHFPLITTVPRRWLTLRQQDW